MQRSGAVTPRRAQPSYACGRAPARGPPRALQNQAPESDRNLRALRRYDRRSPVSHAVQTVPAPALNWAWLRGPMFDWTLILGTALIAIVSGFAVAADPNLFAPILALDLWLLGYHHVVATFTRLAFDAKSFAEHKFLVTWLPLIVLAGVLLLAVTVGTWAIATLYLYWQWFHYARQSYGVSQAFRRKAGVPIEDGWTFQVMFYLVPVWGILHRSAQDPDRFLGFSLKDRKSTRLNSSHLVIWYADFCLKQ